MQETLSDKDLQLAELQTQNAGLTEEVQGLRKVSRREGVNMDYLKNVVIQYISMPLHAPERSSLVPVLAMLLQFEQAELKDAMRATTDPTYEARAPKEVNVQSIMDKSTRGRG